MVPIIQTNLANLTDTLMLHACKKSELHTFSGFREINTNTENY